MKMNTEPLLITDKRTGGSYYFVNHPSGLPIYVMEMPGFSGSSAMLGTAYGSVNTVFRTGGSGEYTAVPEGIAHFLEHKLFENEDCDIFEQYAKIGASGNAYTSFDKTVYLFNCTEDFEKSLSILLNSVQNPYFTKETVEKEQGIIAQEIRMCEDNPYRAGYFNLLRAMYKSHPVRTEIAGTVESISRIDVELLNRCYSSFYSLNNMVLCAAGNCSLDEVLRTADKLLKPNPAAPPETLMPNEPDEVYMSEIEVDMAVGIPLFSLGFKAKPCRGEEMLKKEFASAFLMDMVFGAASRFYKENLESGMINFSFESETLDGNGYFANILSGESKNPKRLRELINQEIKRVKAEGLDRSEFESLKKSRYALLVRSMSSPYGCASAMLGAHMSGCKPFDGQEVLARLTFEDVLGYYDELLCPENSSISIVNIM